LHFLNGLFKTLLAAKGPHQFHHTPHGSKGRDAQHIRIIEVQNALIRVFLKQRIQHGTRLRAVFREDVALAHILGPLAPGQWLAVKGDVADQVEGVQVLAKLIGNGVKRQALGGQGNRLKGLLLSSE
jgi:hypothetical protein